MIKQQELQPPTTPFMQDSDQSPSSLRELYEARELLSTWTRREFRVRYSQSILGAAWAVLQPLALTIIFSLVFSFFLGVPTDGAPAPLFAYLGSLPWTFFASSLTFAIPTLVNNMGLVSKIYFPREILPLAAIAVCLIDFAIGALILVPMLIFYQWPIGPAVLVLPVLVLIQFVFSYAICLFASALNVFFRDVRFIIPLALQVWMYLSPVIYPPNQIPEQYRALYFLNPMAVLIDSYQIGRAHV